MTKVCLQFANILQLLDYMETIPGASCEINRQRLTIICELTSKEIAIAVEVFSAEVIRVLDAQEKK